MRQREVQRGSLDRNAVALGDDPDAFDPGEDLGRRRLIFEACAACENAGTVGATHDDVDVLSGGLWHQALQRALMIEQRIAAGQQDGVRFDYLDVEEQFARRYAIDAEAPALDDAVVPQLRQCAERARARRLELCQPGVTVEIPGDVVDPHEVEAIDSEPLEAVVDRSPRTIRRVVVDDAIGAAELEQAAFLPEV